MWADVHHIQNNSQTWSDDPRRMVWQSLWTKSYGVSQGVAKKFFFGGLANQNLLFMGDGQAY